MTLYDMTHVVLVLTSCDDRRRRWFGMRDKEDERYDLEEKKDECSWLIGPSEEEDSLLMQDAWIS